MLEKPAPVATPIHELLAARWSPRAFDAGRTVARSQVLAMIEAARWAPSCFGEEPWRFLVLDKAQDQASWQKALACLTKTNQVWARNASLLVVVAADPKFSQTGKDDRWHQYDTGAAALSFCLQAVALGLEAHQMGGFAAEPLRLAFNIPPDIALMAVIAVGYQANPEILEEAARQRERAPRTRHALTTRFYEATWSKPIA